MPMRGVTTASTIDAGYPIFALAFIVMTRDEYVGTVTPALQRLKFAYWGHDQVVFHERDIRKKIGTFAMLKPRISSGPWPMMPWSS
ncbi:hypothetical protein [Methylobacterium sp. PvR107]|uniref:hypothetical protein n=1 Tax=Methylobacterium sp. PvR107 TaxID=2806597 RepID=UPI001AE9DF32|nr:hypothetical protein [Methylobacterium sp. PvR107]MBP1180916.1 hypothetical protein [Methylobacterium sp. PvR107]